LCSFRNDLYFVILNDKNNNKITQSKPGTGRIVGGQQVIGKSRQQLPASQNAGQQNLAKS